MQGPLITLSSLDSKESLLIYLVRLSNVESLGGLALQEDCYCLSPEYGVVGTVDSFAGR